MPATTCRRAMNKAVEAAGGRDNLTERDLQMIEVGVRCGLGAASDLLAESLRERDDASDYPEHTTAYRVILPPP